MHDLLVAGLATFMLALLIVRLLASERFARLVLDMPNERSLHDRPIPRTGGLGLMLAAGVGWLLFAGGALGGLMLLGGVLAAVFLIDDVRGLPVVARVAVQFAAAVAFVAWHGPLPFWLAPLLVIGLVWSTNLYNFMDGSNGLAGGMAVIGFGAYAIAAHQAGGVDIALASVLVAAAAAGFLLWNFDPAHIFLGDAGSIPLGFLAAALGVLGWQQGHWPFWFPVLVFSTFIVDSGLTLAKRLVHRENAFQAHRSHYYQRLIRMGWTHRDTALMAYVLMAATAASALLWRTAGLPTVAASLALWAVAFAGVALAIDRRWRASPVRGQ